MISALVLLLFVCFAGVSTPDQMSNMFIRIWYDPGMFNKQTNKKVWSHVWAWRRWRYSPYPGLFWWHPRYLSSSRSVSAAGSSAGGSGTPKVWIGRFQRLSWPGPLPSAPWTSWGERILECFSCYCVHVYIFLCSLVWCTCHTAAVLCLY